MIALTTLTPTAAERANYDKVTRLVRRVVVDGVPVATVASDLGLPKGDVAKSLIDHLGAWMGDIATSADAWADLDDTLTALRPDDGADD